jgi:hypothetical protein
VRHPPQTVLPGLTVSLNLFAGFIASACKRVLDNQAGGFVHVQRELRFHRSPSRISPFIGAAMADGVKVSVRSHGYSSGGMATG